MVTIIVSEKKKSCSVKCMSFISRWHEEQHDKNISFTFHWLPFNWICLTAFKCLDCCKFKLFLSLIFPCTQGQLLGGIRICIKATRFPVLGYLKGNLKLSIPLYLHLSRIDIYYSTQVKYWPFIKRFGCVMSCMFSAVRAGCAKIVCKTLTFVGGKPRHIQ